MRSKEAHSRAGTVETVQRPSEERVLLVMTAAFRTDPPSRWMFPNDAEYLAHFPSFARLYAFGAFEDGAVHGIENSAFAMWFGPSAHPDDDGIIELLKGCIDSTRQEEVFDLLDAMDKFRPAEPHWFLTLIGAKAARRGHGSALMAHMLAHCDAERQLAYLDNTNEANLPFYERFGFRRLGVVRVASCPPIYPMIREPRS